MSNPLTRLIEVISQGVGVVFAPYLIKKTANARANEIRVISSAINDVAKQNQVSVSYKDGAVEVVCQNKVNITLEKEQRSLDGRTSKRLDYQEQRRQQNIESVTSFAASELANEETVPDETPDQDWITRFFSFAQDISTEQMQHLWGRILAGEISKPGTYSLKALNLVRDFKQEDAEQVERVAKLAFRWNKVCFVPNHNQNWLANQREVFQGTFFMLGELEIMYPTELFLRIFRDSYVKTEVFTAGECAIVVDRGQIKGKIQLPVWKFTRIGQEMLNLIPNKRDKEFTAQFATYFVNGGGSAKIARFRSRLPNGLSEFITEHEVANEQPASPSK